MNPLILVWFLVSSIVARASIIDIQAEHKTKTLFKQTETGYTKYTVTVQ